MRKYKFIFTTLLLLIFMSAVPANAESNRKERRLITKGNSLYKDRKFVEAQGFYESALLENPASAEAKYNLALSQIRQIVNPADTSARSQSLTAAAKKNLAEVAALTRTKPGLAAKANYNLGNIEFNSKDYAKAVDYYKQSLRIDPSDDKARKNLRIAQKNLENQKNENKDNQNKDNKENKENKDNKDNNKNQQDNKDNDKENQPEQKPQDSKALNRQAAERILQAVDNKESQTRARVNKASKGEGKQNSGHNSRKW